MPDNNLLGDIAKVFTTLDDAALQSLFDQASAELTERRTTRVHTILTHLRMVNREVGTEEKDESECFVHRHADGQLKVMRIIIPFDIHRGLPVDLRIWVPVIAVLESNSTKYDFRIQSHAEVQQAVIDFSVSGLQTVPGLPEGPIKEGTQGPSIAMVLGAFEYLDEEVVPLQTEEPESLPEEPE